MERHKEKFIEKYYKWKDILEVVCDETFEDIINFIISEIKKGKTIYPIRQNRFRIFDLIYPEDIKVIIVGQDPYPGSIRQGGIEVPIANGIAFGTDTNKLPECLLNIYTELLLSLGRDPIEIMDIKDYSLLNWVKQGILPINVTWTGEKGCINQHSVAIHNYRRVDYKRFTGNLLKEITNRYDVMVVMMGNEAHMMEQYINTKYKVKTSHPSNLGFKKGRNPLFGSNVFYEIAEYIHNKYGETINYF